MKFFHFNKQIVLIALYLQLPHLCSDNCLLLSSVATPFLDLDIHMHQSQRLISTHFTIKPITNKIIILFQLKLSERSIQTLQFTKND